uniref:Slc16a-15 n=1 Tax=Schmidtea mediterranea TaxID=79327 RepID=A0A0H3YF12_SCHMD|nr:slc16a-15 [Schmidtea mediterranea]
MTIKFGEKNESEEKISKAEIDKEDIKNENEIPDGGWGWMVLFATVVMRMLVSGVYVSFGLFIKEFITEFNSNQTILSWLVSFNQAINLGITPLASYLGAKISHRFVALLGSVIVSTSFALPYFVPKLWVIFLSGSILNGIGQGFVYLSSTVILTTYFDKNLSIVLGIYASGFGIASFAMVPLISSLIESFGWRLTMLIYGGCLSLCIVLALTFKPVKFKFRKIEDKNENPKGDESKVNQNELEIESLNNSNQTLESKVTESEDIQFFVRDHEANENENKITTVIDIDKLNPVNIEPVSDSKGYQESKPNESNNKSKLGYGPLFRNPIFMLFVLSNLLFFLGHDNTYIYTKLKATESGVSESKALILLTLIGVGNVIGRLGFGYLGSLKRVNVYFLYVACVIMTGGNVLLSRVAFTYPVMVLYTCGFGIFIGGSITLNAFVITKILNIEQFSIGLAMTSFVQAMGLLGGAPLVGFIYDTTKTLNWSFIVSGSFMICSGLLLIFPLFSREFRKKQKFC